MSSGFIMKIGEPTVEQVVTYERAKQEALRQQERYLKAVMDGKFKNVENGK